jgi:hypothetical protein
MGFTPLGLLVASLNASATACIGKSNPAFFGNFKATRAALRPLPAVEKE